LLCRASLATAKSAPRNDVASLILATTPHPIVKESLGENSHDAANMLVKQINGEWKISAILDWEFAFAGTYLLDMGMMLPYSRKLPACYENKFIAGIQDNC
jgi:hypothetical protein